MNCPNAAQVHAYHDAELSAVARAAVEAHFAGCVDCANLLNDLREVSRQVREAPLPLVTSVPTEQLYNAWHVARDRGVLRIAHWLTAAAAAVLVGSLVLFPAGRPASTNEVATATTPATVNATVPAWEPVALMAPVVEDPSTTRGEELVQVAQWMADDLAGN